MVLWTVFAVLSVTQTQLRTQASYPGRTWLIYFYHQLPDWYLWALLFTPLIYWLSGVVPIRGRAFLPSIGVHVFLCVLNTGLFYSLYLPLKMLVGGRPITIEQMSSRFAESYSERIRYDVMLYWAVLGASTAVRHAVALHRQGIREARLEGDLDRARLDALQGQLRPHFLFNAHHTIAALARRGDSRAVEELVLKLSELLRKTLAMTKKREVSLEEELELTQGYLEIEKVRFSDRLDVVFEVDPQALDRLVPPFVLQPLVENAVKHGVGSSSGVTRIDVAARILSDDLEIRVRNAPTGAGTKPGLGLGLTNLKERLERLYGGDRLTVSIEPGVRGTGTVQIPFHSRRGVV